MADGKVLATYKSPTTASVGEGVHKAISQVLASAGVSTEVVSRVVLGTTHFTNAVVQRQGLDQVCAIRLGAPASRAFPPFSVWPDDLAAAAHGSSAILKGGVNFDGSPITALDETELRTAADRAVDAGFTSVALTSIFAPLSRDNEQTARDIMAAQQSSLTFTLSSDIGNLGVLERENATILNACLTRMAVDVVASIEAALASLGIACPFFFSQNDGRSCRRSSPRASRCGPRLRPTNSIRGAGFSPASGRASSWTSAARRPTGCAALSSRVGQPPSGRAAHQLPDARPGLDRHRRRLLVAEIGGGAANSNATATSNAGISTPASRHRTAIRRAAAYRAGLWSLAAPPHRLPTSPSPQALDAGNPNAVAHPAHLIEQARHQARR